MYEPLHNVVDGIKIYDGSTLHSRQIYEKKTAEFCKKKKPRLFTKLQPSTLTAQGLMTNIYFEEKNVITMLSDLSATDNILMIGCNFGEKLNPRYTIPEKKKNSGRGRKPKPKIKSKRKVQGNGKYFSSQITFLIEHPDSHIHYKIKLFRNGVFQVPGIRTPDMRDLVKPIEILRKYLVENFAEDVQVVDFTAVMRNYKSRLVNQYYHVYLERLEEIILKEKSPSTYHKAITNLYSPLPLACRKYIYKTLHNYNPMNIAEMTYNTDRCFCLIIKFYRPSTTDISKKTTVKLLKKGKINFDGGNSQQEVEELYYWLDHLYSKYKSEILFDIRLIKNKYDSDSSDCDNESIYDDDLNTVVEEPPEESDDSTEHLNESITESCVEASIASYIGRSQSDDANISIIEKTLTHHK